MKVVKGVKRTLTVKSTESCMGVLNPLYCMLETNVTLYVNSTGIKTKFLKIC